MMKLYSYWRSSASYRVRIALALKGLKADVIPVNLLKSEQKQEAYRRVNPQQLLPALVEGDHVLTQSLAIIEYLDERYPASPLLPLDLYERARVRTLSLAVACEIAPICNSGPLNLLSQFGMGEEQKTQWYQHWLAKGFTALEKLLADSDYTGSFCHGSAPGMADCFLVPQVYNARRYKCDLTPYPTIVRIDAACAKLPAFIAAHPSKQSDAM